tara:strand:- start:58 stop:564 length:507 start_codon:yes stop_codon:yes gene_type:complete
MMNLKFPISLVGKRGESLPLRDDVRRSNNNFTSLTSGIQTLSRSSALGATLEIWKAFDNNTGTAWLTTGGLPVWMKIDFGQDQTIYSIMYNVRNDTGGIQSPKNFTIESSDDNINWTLRSTAVDAPRDQDNNLVHDLDEPATARYWRFTCTASYGENRIGLNIMEWRS